MTVNSSYGVEEAWWGSRVAGLLPATAVCVTKSKDDVRLGKEPLVAAAAAVRKAHRGFKLAGVYADGSSHKITFVNRAGTVVLLDADRPQSSVSVWAHDFEVAEANCRRILAALPRSKRLRSPSQIPFTFWHHEPKEGEVCHDLRNVECPAFAEIATNYTPRIREQVERVISSSRPDEMGKIVLWFGPPGTGKTFAVRALAREWASKLGASVEVVLDPEALFGSSHYLQTVLLSKRRSRSVLHAANRRLARQHRAPRLKNPLRLVIVEDAAELFSTECRATQGFARFLNLTDGILGQGLRCVFLLTANEDIGRIDPALTRAGRCLQALEFEAFVPEDAGVWLREHACEDEHVDGPLTLSELYSRCGGAPQRPSLVAGKLGF